MFFKTKIKLTKNSLIVEYGLFSITKEELKRIMQKEPKIKKQLFNLLKEYQNNKWLVNELCNYPESFFKKIEEIKDNV